MESGRLQIEKLAEDNWASWSNEMRWALVLKELWDIVESGLGRTPDDKAKASDRQAVAMIGLNVSRQHQVTVSKSESSKEAWRALEKLFEAKSSARH